MIEARYQELAREEKLKAFRAIYYTYAVRLHWRKKHTINQSRQECIKKYFWMQMLYSIALIRNRPNQCA
jgi:hypothetical protein